ncbi:MAG: hypothetical protein ISQ21_00095 [Alphaproteobacteria bacterium]|nr:hypothetical protein [Alphaproteobacteria bacterium]
MIACVVMPYGMAMAQSDGALDITGQLGVETDTPAKAILDSVIEPKQDIPQFSLDTNGDANAGTIGDTDATGLTIFQNDDDIIFPQANTEKTNDDTPAVQTITSNRSVPSVSISNKDPKGVILATIGIDTDARGVLSRTMWQNSQVSDVIPLMERLPERLSSRRLDDMVRHVMISRAIPPKGATQKADIFVNYKLQWLRGQGLSDPLVQLARQLPEDEKWASWAMVSIDHDLITKNDAEVCPKVDRLRDISLNASLDNDYLSKVQIFCALLSGDDSLASFQLDLLQERGIEDELFFNVLRARIDGTTAKMDAPIVPTGLNMALMDLDNIMISLDNRQNMPIELSQSLSQLGYLNPETAYYQFGVNQHLRLKPLEEQMIEWPYIPQNAINLSVAVTQFTDQTNLDKDRFTEASHRIMLWHSLLSTVNPVEKLDMTLIALEHDFGRIGAEALDIWAPHLADAVTGLTPEDEQTRLKVNQAVMMLVIADYPLPADIITGPDHVAWHQLASDVKVGYISQDMLRNINAQDAMPLLESVGVSVEPLAATDQFANRPHLATGSVVLAYPDMVMLSQHPARDRPAETVLMLAAILQDTPLHGLSRDDAAVLAKALYDAGLVEESRQFAVDIMRAWGAYRAQYANKDLADEDSNGTAS